MYCTQARYAGASYRIAVFPHPTRAGYFSYHSEIDGAPVLNPIYPSRGTSIGAYRSQSSAFNSGVFHTLIAIKERGRREKIYG